MFNLGMRVLTGLPFRDTQCGFKLMPTAVAQSLLQDQLVSGFAFDVEILMRARNAGLAGRRGARRLRPRPRHAL